MRTVLTLNPAKEIPNNLHESEVVGGHYSEIIRNIMTEKGA